MNNTELKRPVDKSGTPQTIRLGPPNKVKGPSILARIHAAKTVEEVDGVMADVQVRVLPDPVKLGCGESRQTQALISRSGRVRPELGLDGSTPSGPAKYWPGQQPGR